MWAPFQFWLPETGDVRTFTPRITIPYNPFIMAMMRRTTTMTASPKKLLVNIFQKARHYSDLLQRRVVNSKAEIARKEGISRARITQILNLAKLAPEILEYLTSLTDQDMTSPFTERRLRGIATIKDHKTQLRKFREFKRKANKKEIKYSNEK